MALFKRGSYSQMGKRGWIGARDQKELDRPKLIRDAVRKAIAENKKGDFWNVMRMTQIRHDDPKIAGYYELWCAAFDAAKRNKP